MTYVTYFCCYIFLVANIWFWRLFTGIKCNGRQLVSTQIKRFGVEMELAISISVDRFGLTNCHDHWKVIIMINVDQSSVIIMIIIKFCRVTILNSIKWYWVSLWSLAWCLLELEARERGMMSALRTAWLSLRYYKDYLRWLYLSICTINGVCWNSYHIYLVFYDEWCWCWHWQLVQYVSYFQVRNW